MLSVEEARRVSRDKLSRLDATAASRFAELHAAHSRTNASFRQWANGQLGGRRRRAFDPAPCPEISFQRKEGTWTRASIEASDGGMIGGAGFHSDGRPLIRDLERTPPHDPPNAARVRSAEMSKSALLRRGHARGLASPVAVSAQIATRRTCEVEGDLVGDAAPLRPGFRTRNGAPRGAPSTRWIWSILRTGRTTRRVRNAAFDRRRFAHSPGWTNPGTGHPFPRSRSPTRSRRC